MPFPFDLSPPILWPLAHEDKRLSCEVRFVPTGTQIRSLRGSALHTAHRELRNSEENGEPPRNRTVNPQIKSLLLCQLS